MTAHNRDDSDGINLGLPVLLTVEQAATWCQVSREIMDDWATQPGFPVIRRPRFVRIHREALDKWLEQRAIASNPEPSYEVPVSPRRRAARWR